MLIKKKFFVVVNTFAVGNQRGKAKTCTRGSTMSNRTFHAQANTKRIV
jgi:hypothetical protein